MSGNRFTLGFALISFFLVLPETIWSADNSCISCHQDSDFYAQHPKLYEYYQQWLDSPHQQAGLTCDGCHGGKADATTMEKAHAGVLPMSDKRSVLHYQQQPDTCGQCHRAKQRQFVQSKHYTALMDQRSAPTCTTCHPAMNRRPELRTMVLNACRNCHGDGNSENLPLIADRAENVFNQLNIVSGLLGWTRIHFESQEWPDDSKKRVAELGRRYDVIVDKIHQFDLQQTEDTTIEILGELRELFKAAQRAHEQRAEGS